MAALSARRQHQRSELIWPGFIDALTTLLLVIIFVLVAFVLSQFYLAAALTGRDEALARLNAQLAELGDLLAMERQANTDLRATVAQLSASLQDSTRSRDRMASQLDELMTRLRAATEQADARGRELETLAARRQTLEAELGSEKRISAEARAQVELLNRQIAELRAQLSRIEAALRIAERQSEEQKVVIADLGKRLNLALAAKVEELDRYRSEFFGKLREALGNRRDIQVVGDRFVFQSEVLFESARADLNVAGREQLAEVARTLIEISSRIPPELKWILRVDGHTDRVPIATAQFPSNWELSQARALSVVRYLIERGIPPARLVAAGFGEHQPIDSRDDDVAKRRNRRIELKLTDR
ncbi:MAG: peptidoglycan -binding protein [Alphaproteobacteria bacterium]|nr:peptidoglycan -binding protein [Alphaproteobacteria bacterium]